MTEESVPPPESELLFDSFGKALFPIKGKPV
jgi:hypothetical protein